MKYLHPFLIQYEIQDHDEFFFGQKVPFFLIANNQMSCLLSKISSNKDFFLIYVSKSITLNSLTFLYLTYLWKTLFVNNILSKKKVLLITTSNICFKVCLLERLLFYFSFLVYKGRSFIMIAAKFYSAVSYDLTINIIKKFKQYNNNLINVNKV